MAIRLEAMRVNKRLTQEQMADRIGVHVNTYRAWEDSPKSIKMEYAIKISNVLECDLEDIDFSE